MQQWPPIADAKRQCANCGAHLSKTFRRGYAADDGRVHGCPGCCTYRELEGRVATDGGAFDGH